MKELAPKDIVEGGLCIGCGSCVSQTKSGNAAMKFDPYGELKPVSPHGWLQQQSAEFTRTCPFSPSALNEDELALERFPSAAARDSAIGSYEAAYVGYVAEEAFRLQGSSGGMVTWVAAELLRTGLVDGIAHVVATGNPQEEGRFFQYRISHTDHEVQQGAKSRYYPIELSEVLRSIRALPGRYALVGIPCFIKAVHLLRNEDPVLRERIAYTLGLFCGHMKSARFVESLAWQMKVPIANVNKVEFRYKDPNRPANWYNAMLTMKDGMVVNRDWWNLVDGDWGAGFFMNNACNFCDDVTAETADVCFGDAWVEPYSSDGKGTNVVVARLPEIHALIEKAISEKRLQLERVDADFVTQTQAAGFRQRREGLAYRLTWAVDKVQPCKRVRASRTNISAERKQIYRMRYRISKWSHRFFRVALSLNLPKVYLQWARLWTSVYYGLAYHKGKRAEMYNRLKGFKL